MVSVAGERSQQLKTNMKYIWGNYELETRTSTGRAARSNRGSYTGQKTHRVCVTEIIRVVDEAAEMALKHATFGKQFLATGKPVTFSCAPLCGCTRGQNAALEVRQVIEKQNAVVCQRDFARRGIDVAAEQARVAGRVVRRAERSLCHKRLAGFQQADDAVNLGCL